MSANFAETMAEGRGAKRQKTPNEIALSILLAALTLISLMATVTLLPFSLYSVRAAGQGTPVTVTVLTALFVGLLPTTLGGLLSAIGIAGMDRGTLTTFSIANDVAKHFAILPAALTTTYPVLDRLNVMRLGSPQSAILSAVIFNALILVALIPLARQRGSIRHGSASRLLRDNLLIYGLGGIIVSFVGIKLIDLALRGLGLA